MWRKLSVLVLSFCLLSPCLSAEVTPSPRSATAQAIASMRLDLQLLKISISNYETKINELQILIVESQDDLTEQKKYLMDSEAKLGETLKQYNELNEICQSLSKQYKQSIQIIKYGTITALAIIVTEGIVIALK